MEAGLFFLLLGLAMLGFILVKKVVDYLIVSMVLFLALSLTLFVGEDVVVTKIISNSTTVETEYNSTGHLVSNSTIFTPRHEDQTSIITGMHIALGWTFFALSLICLFLWLKMGLFNR